MWARETTSPRVGISASVLPFRGSAHPAFLEMKFAWGPANKENEAYRDVVLPPGFSLRQVDGTRWEILNKPGHVIAVAVIPDDGVNKPSLSPVKRFSLHSKVSPGPRYTGVAKDWDSTVFKTPLMVTQDQALNLVKEWLNSNKPGWDSYVSSVNFDGREPI